MAHRLRDSPNLPVGGQCAGLPWQWQRHKDALQTGADHMLQDRTVVFLADRTTMQVCGMGSR
jgi:hypothetical protein